MAATFTWHAKFTEAMEFLEDDGMRREFALGVVLYGSAGIWPDFEYPLNAIFATIREDIDHSISKREAAARARAAKEAQE